MVDLNDLFYFVHVVDHRGFAAAGRALCVPKSKLSRRIAALEERLGVRLIQRSTRQFNVTKLGHAYYQHCKAMLVEAEAAQEVIESYQARPRGIIRLTCPITLLHAHVADMLAEFMSLYPEIDVHLNATNRRIDVISEGVDVAIRVRPPPIEDSNLIMRVLSDRGQCLLASPALILKHGKPSTPEELRDWPSLALGESQQQFEFQLFNNDGKSVSIPLRPRLITRDMIALRAAALAGVGIVQLPKLLVRKELADNSLETILPDWEPKREIIHLVYPSRRGLLPAIRLLIEHLRKCYQDMDEE